MAAPVGSTFISALIRKMRSKQLSVSFAESCTGGWVSKLMTDVAGASSVYKGSLIVYGNESKRDLLKIPDRILKKFGAVSGQTAREMAKRVRKCFSSDLGISITGIAGPGGGTPKKPVGLIFIGLADKKKSRAWRFQLKGSRRKVRLETAARVFEILKGEVG